MAWDSIIQIIYVDEDTNLVGKDGFYYSDQDKEITSINFMGDSVLTAVVDKQVKVLYTTKFRTGDFAGDEIIASRSKVGKQQSQASMRKLQTEIELELSPNINNIKTLLLKMD